MAGIRITGPHELGAGPGRHRHVRVFSPTKAPAADRPLLIMFDGQNVFDDAPSYAGGWHAHRAVERLAARVVRPVIVAIDHGGVHRMRELSPFASQGSLSELDHILAHLAGTLLPRLRLEYGITADPRRTIIAGASLGGLAALYATLRYPHVFGGAIAMSPSLWVRRGAMFDWVAAHGARVGQRVYLDAGALEAKGNMLAGARRMGGLLQARGGVELSFRADPRGHHREACWRRRLLPALRFHFGTSRSISNPRGA